MRGGLPTAIAGFIRSGSYAGLRAGLAGADRGELARAWPRLRPLHKLAAFKLMDAASALQFYRALPYRERYFLFSGFPLQSIAPLIADAPVSARRRRYRKFRRHRPDGRPYGRRLFVQLPARCYGDMLEDLSREPAKALR